MLALESQSVPVVIGAILYQEPGLIAKEKQEVASMTVFLVWDILNDPFSII